MIPWCFVSETMSILVPQHSENRNTKQILLVFFSNILKLTSLAGVQKIMVTGTSVRNSKEALRLTRLYPSTIYSTAGKLLYGNMTIMPRELVCHSQTIKQTLLRCTILILVICN